MEVNVLSEPEKIVRYWHAVELLQPQSAPKIKKRTSKYQAFFHDVSSSQLIPPWSLESIVNSESLPEKREWSHTLYAYLYDGRVVAEALKGLYGADQGYREPQFRESTLFSAKFNTNGQLLGSSFVLSSEAWFLGRALAGQDWTYGFEDDQRKAAEQAQTLLQDQVSGASMKEFTFWVLQFLGLVEFFGSDRPATLRFRSQPVKIGKPVSEDDPLNSFLLNDLNLVANNIRKGFSSEALNQYLRRHDPQQRVHIDKDVSSSLLIERLLPQAYPDSCWPSEHHLGLVYSQQLAVNTVMSTLTEGRGLLGINGPPGTGKTTLLRDLVASIVTNRADILAKLSRASDAFIQNGREIANDGGKEQMIYKLNPSFFGFEIVVASSNNGAVENITHELPQRDKVDESWLPDGAYFANLGELMTGRTAWGLISGALGSKARRRAFVDAYFFGQSQSSKPATGAQDDLETLFAGSADLAASEFEQATAQQKRPSQGFQKWLTTQITDNGDLRSEQRRELWKKAVDDYEAAKAQVRALTNGVSHIRGLINTLQTTRENITEATGKIQFLETRLALEAEKQARLDSEEFHPAVDAFKEVVDALASHQKRKPGFWEKLISLWGASRAWNSERALLQDQRDYAKTVFDKVVRLAKQLEASRSQCESQINDQRQALLHLQSQGEVLTLKISQLAVNYGADHLLTWLRDGVIDRGDAIELTEPWKIEGWRQARARVFIQALKLHRTFFELEAKRMLANLSMVNALLTGAPFQGLSRDAIRSAWASLFMVVPVVSSTFASFARSFSSFDHGEIGWLLVDEAGQASPQAAVGALWRSRRALLVGDPLQLKPIITVSDAVLTHMRTRYGVDAHWLPNRHSAQTLADQATVWGQMAGPADSKAWMGLPLVVHRRCDKPMFAIANRIAYDGAMVYGTMAPHADKETRAQLPTGWIHVGGSSDGNWVPAEGEALRKLLALLHEDGVDAAHISVITPFKDVLENLRRLLGEQVVCGTIHTMQGKESPIVIIVLGGNAQARGTRDWAVSEPNLLNVAVTRAKRRCYVIGDHNDWKSRALFSDVMDLLPELNLRGDDTVEMFNSPM